MVEVKSLAVSNIADGIGCGYCDESQLIWTDRISEGIHVLLLVGI